eukprot:1543305-Pyramimonas_sp.AAC.1
MMDQSAPLLHQHLVDGNLLEAHPEQLRLERALRGASSAGAAAALVLTIVRVLTTGLAPHALHLVRL